MDAFHNQTDEARTWQAFREGSREAFAVIYEKHYYALFNYGSKISSDRAVVKDSIQNLFVKLWKTKEKLGTPTSIKFYLFKALRRMLIDELTQKNSHLHKLNVPENYDFEITLSPEVTMMNDQAERERRAFMINALQVLTKKQKEAIFLKFYDQLSYEEVASVMSMSTKAVYNLIARAIDTLKKHTPKADIHLFSLLFIILFLV